MSGYCDFCRMWHSGSCCHPNRPIPNEVYKMPSSRTTSREEQGMSTTDKLAQALREAMEWNWLDDDMPNDRRQLCEKALAEYDATPAGEVTADAVEVEIADQLDRWLELGGVMDTTLRINLAKWSKHLRALAAAFPILMQQVERLKAELNAVSQSIGDTRYMDPPDGGDVSLSEQVMRMRAERDALSAENARLAKDAERYTWLKTNDTGIGYTIVHQWRGRFWDAQVDEAIAAQAKQE